jgi:FSR family fosmidomycin resistance protein-like MFS transporter
LIKRVEDALSELLTQVRLVRFSLYSLTFVDEVVSTVPVLAVPLIRTELNLEYSQVGWLLGIGGLSAWLVEPAINAASDHWPKRRIMLISMLGLVVALALAGSSPTFSILLLAFLLMGATNGPILGMGLGFLIETNVDESLRTMTRWTLMAALGDLAGPALIAAAFAFGMGWRALFWASALIWLVSFVALAIQRLPAKISTAEEDEPLSWRVVRENVALALRTPFLLRWLFLVLMPSFLDEMFLAFSALLLQDRLGMSPAAISVALGIQVTGGLVGLLLLERFGHRFQPSRLLGWLALVTLAGLSLLVLSPTPLLAIIALWITGVGASGWYPIASAEAYRALPGRLGTVRAIYSLGTPLEVAVPLLIGLAAERWGIQVGMSLIMLAPIAVLLLRPRGNELAPVTPTMM